MVESQDGWPYKKGKRKRVIPLSPALASLSSRYGRGQAMRVHRT